MSLTPKIQLFTNTNPFYINGYYSFRVGYYDASGNLTDVTSNAIITIQFGFQNIKQISNTLFQGLYEGSVGITAIYTLSGNQYSTFYNFVIISDIIFPNSLILYNNIKAILPNGYSSNGDALTSIDDLAASQVLGDIYRDFLLSLNNLFPEMAQDKRSWIALLFGNEYYISENDTNISLLLQHIHNLPTLQIMVPFTAVWFISKYIYLRTGQNIYVSLFDNNIDVFEYWILGDSQRSILNKTTYLSDRPSILQNIFITIYDGANPLPIIFRNELNILITKIIRASAGVSILYDKIPAQDGLITDIGNIYPGDTRLGSTWAGQYQTNNFFQLNGLIAAQRPIFITDINIIPVSGSTLSSTVPTTLTIIGTFLDTYQYDITRTTQISRQTNLNLFIIGWNLLIPYGSGSVSFTISYGTITKTITYNLV